MARIKKTERKYPAVNPGSIVAAAEKVLTNKMTVRAAAAAYGVSKTTLSRHLCSFKAKKEDTPFSYVSNIQSRKIFNEAEEKLLVNYLLQASKYHYGLTVSEVSKLAYQFATTNQRSVPLNWKKQEKAGKDWYLGFMRRHSTLLSLRKPEPTSLSRATSFNRNTVNEFFDNYESLLHRSKFSPNQIFNLDESGITTVHVPPKVVAAKGVRQVGQVTSGERGQLVTMIAAVNAIGNAVPPMLIFPRKNFKDHMLKGAPPGTIGAANPSGWSSPEKFVMFLNHFIKHAKPTSEFPVILLMDNHETHISIEAIDMCKKNGIFILTFPPHTSHKLQPLDHTVFGPFKTCYNAACSEWMLMHAGRPITIYDIAECVGRAYPISFTPKNITSGFLATGIWPYNRTIFRDDEFLSSFVTDRPSTSIDITKEISSETSEETAALTETLASPITLEEIRPFPKAGPRKLSNRGRKRGRSTIFTDTPEKDKLLERCINKMKETSTRKKKKSIQRKLMLSPCTSSEDEDVILSTLVKSTPGRKPMLSDLYDDDDSSDACSIKSTSSHNGDKTTTNNDGNHQSIATLNVGDFAVVKFAGKRSIVAFVGHVEKIDQDEYEMSFLRRRDNSWSFFYPAKEDRSYVYANDVLLKLDSPEQTTQRSFELIFNDERLHYVEYKIC